MEMSDLLKAPAIHSGTTVRRSAMDPKGLKLYWRSEKRPHFSTSLLFTSFSKNSRAVVFSNIPLPNIFKCIDNRWDLATIWKKYSFGHILKTSSSMSESFGSQFFRTTTGIQSRAEIFDESRLVMSFLTNFGITGILCSFRLVLERSADKEIPSHQDKSS